MRKQHGFSGILILAIIVLCFFSFFSILKVFPLYTQDWTVEAIFEDLESDVQEEEYSRSRVMDSLQKRFEINGVSDLMEYVEVSGKGSKIIIDMEYEQRVSLISNIELVATFSHYIDLSE